MKVKPVTYKGEKLVQYWCPGCGQFHVASIGDWNGDVDKPTIMGVQSNRTNIICDVRVTEGVLTYLENSRHRLAGKSLPMQHEEAWRDGGNNWNEVKPPDGSKPEIKT